MKFEVLINNTTLNKTKFFKKGEIVDLGELEQKVALMHPGLFKPYKEIENVSRETVDVSQELVKEEVKEDMQENHISKYENMTKADLKKLLKEKAIDFNSKDSKSTLVKKLK